MEADHDEPGEKKVFREINVWERFRGGGIAVYRCFEVLPDGKYCVQSRDRFEAPADEEVWRLSEGSFLKLLAGQTPALPLYDTLEEAVRRYERDERRRQRRLST